MINRYGVKGIQEIIAQPPYGRVLGSHFGGSIVACDYVANCQNGTGATTGTFAANTLYALPLVAPARGGVISVIGCEVTTASAGNSVEVLLYANQTDQSDIYPGALLAFTGNMSATSTGIKTVGITQALTPGAIYWLGLTTNASIVCRGLAVGGVAHFLGMDSTATNLVNMGITVAETHGAHTANFPAGGTWITAIPIPILRYRFSA